ncbi:hybrid sensor histidine kinase/response regulator [Roseobacter cerasinus]|uniref:histidine kinase n=1 Tax=Roseobacter cerasinus TaxID=2602289 RepID=A0A640VSU0_9RHOB|nr:ATP-binding protein [Roseobacter cerasinus]GFE50674.1 hybrid sensor histidine kinase/response regulator [Roseobacter cerasinus]
MADVGQSISFLHGSGMVARLKATREKRTYNRWVANETMEDFALRYTARRARRWSYGRVANTAIGSISFLALEAIGATITLTYGFDTAITAIMLVGAILFLTGFPISYYAAKYGLDIDLMTRGAGFGYLGSTITSLIYASFTFIFFALEAAILALALKFTLGVPLFLGYVASSLVVIPLVVHGFSKISTFQAWTQPLWVLLHALPFVLLAFSGYDLEMWTGFEGNPAVPDTSRLLMLGAASGVVFSLVAQIGEQVDFLRFLPEPKTRSDKRKWWLALICAGPGWSVLGMLKMLAGSYLVTLAIRESVPPQEATDPTRMYHTAFEQVLSSPALVLGLTAIFVILSQLKINVTNAYAGSIAWSNFFSRLTKSHPGRVVWLVFNVAIALMLMELGVFTGLEHVLSLYSHVAVAWIGALVADLVVNKPLGLSPKGIEFRRSHLYDVNPVGIGAMVVSCVVSLLAYAGLFGPLAQAFSSFVALLTAFTLAPILAWATGGRYYLARDDTETSEEPGLQTCTVCEYRFDAEDTSHCPFHFGRICSLCCSLDAACQDHCKPHGRLDKTVSEALHAALPEPVAKALQSRLSRFLVTTSAISLSFGVLLLFIRGFAGADTQDAVLTIIFCMILIVIGISVWMFILVGESRRNAMAEAERQTELLLKEIRAHDRTEQALQQAKEKAEAANLAKTRYMSGLSHELRTPLNAIYGFAQLLEKDPGLTDWRGSITSIRRSSEHLAGLIDGLLDIARIEAGRLEIMRDRVNLRVLLHQIAAIFEAEAAAKGIAFDWTIRGRLPTLVGTDEKRLRQIIINLLSNAIRYTDTGRVALDLAYRNEVALITVTDTGIGIEPQNIPRIWRPFERAGQSGQQGSGLGLTITKLLVEILGGEIDVESSPGEGSIFSVKLMLPSITPGVFDLEDRRDDAALPAFVGYTGPRQTVLVVDDDTNHLSLVEQFLSHLGFVVLIAPSTDMAEQMLSEARPDIMLLDIDMPDQDGWSFAQELRFGDWPHLPIIVISGHADEESVSRPKIALHDAFMAKPFNLDELLMQIAELLKLKLVPKEDQDTREIDAVRLGAEDRMRLIESASLGHIAGVRQQLHRLRAKGLCDAGTLRKLDKHMEHFDLGGIVNLLEDVEDAAQ